MASSPSALALPTNRSLRLPVAAYSGTLVLCGPHRRRAGPVTWGIHRRQISPMAPLDRRLPPPLDLAWQYSPCARAAKGVHPAGRVLHRLRHDRRAGRVRRGRSCAGTGEHPLCRAMFPSGARKISPQRWARFILELCWRWHGEGNCTAYGGMAATPNGARLRPR